MCRGFLWYVLPLQNNEASVMQAVERIPSVRAAFDVGLLENLKHPELAVSPDGVVVMNDGSVWLLEIKSRLAPSTIASARRVKDDHGESFECVFGDAVFWQAALNSAYRMQLAHQLTVVSNAKGVVFAVATNTGLVYTAFIRADNTALKPHRDDLLQVVRRLQLAWAFAPNPKVPGFVPTDVALELSSHLSFFRQLRTWIVKHGPLPPVKRFKWSIQVDYNHMKPGCDIWAKMLQSLTLTGLTQDFESLFASRAVMGRVVCAWRTYLLCSIKQLLMNNSTTLSQMRRAMTKVGKPLEAFVWDCGLCWVSTARKLMELTDTEKRRREAEASGARKRRRMAERDCSDAIANSMADELFVQSELDKWIRDHGRGPSWQLLNTPAGRVVRGSFWLHSITTRHLVGTALSKNGQPRRGYCRMCDTIVTDVVEGKARRRHSSPMVTSFDKACNVFLCSKCFAPFHEVDKDGLACLLEKDAVGQLQVVRQAGGAATRSNASAGV